MSLPSTASSSPAAALASLGSWQTLVLSWAAAGVLSVHIKIGKMNAMSQLFWAEMPAAFARIGACPEVRVVMLTTEGKIFTAGLDLMDHQNSFLTENPDGQDVARRTLRIRPAILRYQDAFTAVEAIPQPVVVCIQGACIGGGVDLITSADIRLASEEAYFSVKEVDVAMAADVGTLQRLPKVCGNQSLVREWCLTGRRISAAEALSAGLVSRVCKDRVALAKEGLALCVDIASKSPLAVVGTKVMLNYSRDHSVREGLEYMALWNASALQSEDVLKAMQAGVTKQVPIYSNL